MSLAVRVCPIGPDCICYLHAVAILLQALQAMIEVQCHHGLHRSPVAAAAVAAVLEEKAAAASSDRRAGTRVVPEEASNENSRSSAAMLQSSSSSLSAALALEAPVYERNWRDEGPWANWPTGDDGDGGVLWDDDWPDGSGRFELLDYYMKNVDKGRMDSKLMEIALQKLVLQAWRGWCGGDGEDSDTTGYDDYEPPRDDPVLNAEAQQEALQKSWAMAARAAAARVADAEDAGLGLGDGG